MLAAKRRASANSTFDRITGQSPAAPNRQDWRRFDLRSALVTTALGTGVLAAASLWPADGAMAGCVDYDPTGTPNTVVCDTAQTTFDGTIESNAVQSNSAFRGYLFDDFIPNTDDVEVTITTDGDIDGFGLAVQTSAPGAAITVDHQGAISIDDGNTPVFGGTGVFSLTTNGGDVTYTGNGSVIDNDGGNDGLVIDTSGGNIDIGAAGTPVTPNYQGAIALRTNSGTGDQNIFLDGGTMVVTEDFGDGMFASSSTGNINISLTGNTQITTTVAAPNDVWGVHTDSLGGATTIASDADMGSAGFELGRGISSFSTDGPIAITQTGGTIMATDTGIFADVDGVSGDISITTNGGSQIVMSGGVGIIADQHSATGGATVNVGGIITGSDIGVSARIFDATNSANVGVTASGDIEALVGRSISAITDGTGNATVALLDGVTMQGGILAQSTTGDAGIFAGDNVTVIGNSPGMASITAGGDATVMVGDGALVTGSSGIVVDQTSPAGAGNATVVVGANGTIIGDGTDPTDDYDGNGIFAGNQGTGATSVTTGADTSVTGEANGIFASQTNAGNINDITISTDGPVTGDGGIPFVLAPYTDAFVGAGLPTTGLGIGVSNEGSGNIIVTAGGTVTGADTGIQLLAAGGGDIALATDEAVVGTSGTGILTRAIGGDTAILTNGAVTGFVDGIDASATGAGTIAIQANDSVDGLTGDGIVTSAVDGDTAIQTNGAVTGSDDGIDATATGAGAISIQANGSVEGLTGDGINASSSGGGIAIQANAVSGGGDGINTVATGGLTSIVTNGFVVGVGDGIDAAATGAGAISILTNGSVDGLTGDGIVTSAVNGDTAIETNGPVTGEDDGIDATATGAGAISILANGSVDGITGDGIVTSAVNGDTAIETNGPVTGEDDGIDATATGTGAIAILTTDTVDGLTGDGIVTSAFNGDTAIQTDAAVDGGDDGIDAAATGAGNIAIAANTNVTGEDDGIVARTTTGNIAIAGNGPITGDNDANLDGDGINAASTAGGNIDVDVGAVSGASGIVLSVVGGGTIDLSTGGTVVGTVGDGINTAAVNGDTTILTTGPVTGADDGIDASATGAGAIAIVANANITGEDDGIVARTTTGNIAIAGDGPITGDNDANDDGDGINAASTAGGNIDVDVGAVSGASGIVLSVVGGGTIDLSTGGTVVGTVGDGINTAAVNGDTTILTTGPVTGADDGIDASATGAGAIAIVADGAVTGVDDGIVTSTSGGDTSIQTNAAVEGGDDGIDATATGAGAITIVTNDSVDGIAGDGIVTSAFDGDTSIETNGPVTGGDDGIDATATGAGAISIATNDSVIGTAGDGILTSAVDGDTDIDVNASVVRGQDGIDATATGGGNLDIDVADGARVTGSTGAGVSTTTATGEASIDNAGIIQGAFAAISGATSTVLEVVNQTGGLIRNLSADIGDLAISVTGAGRTDIDNDGTILGRVALGDGDDTFSNSGQWTTTGNSDFGAGNDSVTNSGTWETTGTTTFDFGAGNDSVTNTGLLDVANQAGQAESTHFANLEAFTNASTGVIDMIDNNAPNVRDTLTIDGVYTGEPGSIIQMDVALVSGDAQDGSDIVVLDGGNPAQGTSDLVFNIVSTGVTATTANTNRVNFDGGQLVDPVTVVENRGNLTTSSGDDVIPLARSGLITYDLESSGNNFQIVSELDTGLAGGLLLPIPATLATVAFTTQRTPNPITATCIDPENKANAQGGWVRGLAGEFNTESAGEASTGGVASDLASENRTRFQTLQGGFDHVWCNLGNFASTLHVGVTVGHTWGDSIQEDPDPANGIFGTDVAFDTFFVGPYAAITRGNFAAQAGLRFDYHSLELSNQTAGINEDGLDVDAEGISGQASMSYDFELATLTLTPDVGVNVSNTEIDSFDIAGGTVALDDLWSVMGHAGVTARTKPLGLADNLFVVPFASATLYHEFIDHADGEFDIGGTVVEAESNRVGTFGQVGVGANAVRLGNVVTGRPTLFGGARFDLQVGERIQGATATVFGRVQF